MADKVLALLMQCAWLQIKQTFLCRHPGEGRDPRQAAPSLPVVDGGLRRHDVVGSWRIKLLAMLMRCAAQQR
jgi:hypothetical protein